MEFARAHRRHGIMTCAKHFPGHGSARGDTHLGAVDVTRHWTERELIPFERLIRAGQCDAIMTAHVFNARLDADRPATLSRAVLHGMLRGRLGFEGVIVSDDMEMKAIANEYSLEEALRLGIGAGLDVLCFGNNMSFDPDIVAKAAGMIEGLVEAGKITEARIDESFRRVQQLKHQFNLI
jgi:beta-N-acetylhexosaminidase